MSSACNKISGFPLWREFSPEFWPTSHKLPFNIDVKLENMPTNFFALSECHASQELLLHSAATRFHHDWCSKYLSQSRNETSYPSSIFKITYLCNLCLPYLSCCLTADILLEFLQVRRRKGRAPTVAWVQWLTSDMLEAHAAVSPCRPRCR
jgi:hypothetical protein